MVTVIAQLSDVHVGGPEAGSGERLSAAVDEINRMTRQPDLVLLTGDVTHSGSAAEWAECKDRLAALTAPWTAIPGNHDRGIAELAGHRSLDVGPLRLVLLDTSSDEFTAEDQTWLDDALAAEPDTPTIVAVHQPPFETGIWWMDCIGLRGAERFEAVVRRHGQVVKVLSGHVHRAIQSQLGCVLAVGRPVDVGDHRRRSRPGAPAGAVSRTGDVQPARLHRGRDRLPPRADRRRGTAQRHRGPRVRRLAARPQAQRTTAFGS